MRGIAKTTLKSIEKEGEIMLANALSLANPKLSTEEKTMVEAEYGMTNGVLLIRPRQSMCHYVLQSLNAEIVDN
ncbi:hypothetical protein Q668_05735 [Alcanivorax sp. PN-3]|uniref:hypothetical protein n=1 Tax=Alloalcanivorax xenomutans TaxID=1094342 RepID=UPI0003B82225|nr:hypothetical protein [Alloalcanivorax xenomutans]ERS15430.1 hypothetical protein Q668_05735 [Alcanivorax sp. PN-3]CUR45444.1 hypothetical protein BN2364_1003 [Alloalcanivorax xenomutans]